MATFYVCHCGYPESNHEFRHEFENRVKVTRKRVIIKKTNDQFYVDALSFPEKTKTMCSVPNCSAANCTNPVTQHETSVIGHAYVPKEIVYHQINLVLPLKTKCNKNNCGILLENHKEILTHSFTTKVIVENKGEYDKISLFHPDDDDIKIVLEN